MNKKYFLPVATASLLMVSCADEFNPEYNVDDKRPVNLAKLAELADYQPLKEYCDPNSSMKLGAALSAADFNQKLAVYNVAVTNFHEIVAGNAMKYASCVDNKGGMNFSTVNEFVNNAEEAGLTVYGHTLAWHAQQQPKYLNSLIADKPRPVDPSAGQEVEVTDYTLDFGTLNNLSWNGCPDNVTIEYGKDGCLVFSNTEPIDPWYAFQYWVVNGINLKEGREYTITINCRYEGAEDAHVNFKLGDWGGGLEKPNFTIPANGDFADVVIKGNATMDSNGIFLQHADGFVGTVYWNTVTITHKEVSAPSDVEYKDVETEVKKRVIKVTSDDMVEYAWDTQFWFKTNEPMHAGDSYDLSVDVYAYKEAKAGTQLHNAPGEYVHWSAVGDFKFSTEWETLTATGSIPSEGEGTYTVALNLNDFAEANSYFFANFSFKINGKEQINNGDLSSDDNSSFFTKECRGDIVNSPILSSYIKKEKVEVPKTEQVEVKKRCIIVKATEQVADPWDNQFWIVANEPFHAGDSWEFSAEIRADKEAAPGTQIHGKEPGSYMHWAAVGNPHFGTDWDTYTSSGTIPSEGDGGQSIAFNLNDFSDANNYYFGNISFKINGKEMVNNGDLKTDDTSSFYEKLDRGATVHSTISDGYIAEQEMKSTIPLTPEEKHDTLVWAMDKWIAGMMDACEGKVKAWDVVNEAIAGGGDEGGFYPLQHGTEENTNDFFWQDGMGDLEYVRQAVKLARKYYAQSLEDKGGDDGQLKLFINDYNLESDWDQNHKVKSLINWIKRWEEDGVTKIDGIGTQMHVSYYEDENIQASKEAAIKNMFKLMAESGKLVRISELDMGYVQKGAKEGTKTSEMTDEMEQKMEQFYTNIIKWYQELVPAAQQYGITQWCLTDSPAGSGWRPAEPVGLWDLDWNRKYTYRGWVNALQK